MTPKNLHIGLSAFNNAYWKGIFYPEGLPASKRFEYYCTHFNTYELNASFYKFPTLKGLQAWYDKSPEGFLFSVKMYKGVTHFRRFNECSREIADFYTVCREGLKEKLANVLIQLPPSFHYSPDRLGIIITSLDPSFSNVVEFRHESWWRQDVMEALQEHGIIFCSVSYPGLSDAIVKTAGTGYARLHGVPKLFYSGYSEAFLEDMLSQIGLAGFDSCFVYFNNTAGNEGILDALEFSKTVSNV